MREITGHKVNPVNDRLKVEALDGSGPGGASHRYLITDNPLEDVGPPPSVNNLVRCELNFQNGPISEVGVNGITHEALLSILIDRLECFQAGPFDNKYNEAALTHLRLAVEALHNRTLERMARGVEGTCQK